MNPLNYASLEASKRLSEAGILKRNPEIGDRVSVNCEGDIHEGFVVNIDKNSSDIEVRFDGCEETSWMEHWEANILYSMAEVWRELINDTLYLGCTKNITHAGSLVGDVMTEFSSDNPTDALINLLIWTRKKRI